MREKYCWLIAGGWFVLREKYCWLVADKPNEQGACMYPKESPVEVAKREELADITAGDRLASKAGTLGDDEARQGELEELLDPRGLL
jgi:hypothetical protein